MPKEKIKKPQYNFEGIIERLRKIEKIIEKEFPQQICNHQWYILEGTTAQNLRQCRLCGKMEYNPIPRN